jgi:mRNA interferase MazF
MAKGDVVLITFPFTDLSGSKLRPAIVLVETELDLTVSFITTQINWKESTDLFLSPTQNNGLKKDSLVRLNKIATLDRFLAKGLIGKLDDSEVLKLNEKLKILFHLN